MLLSVFEPSPAVLASLQPQPKQPKQSTSAPQRAVEAQVVPVEAEPQIEATRLHRAAAAGDADKVLSSAS